MKKLFTLFALLVLALGANAKEIVDVEVDFSKMADGSEIKFYGWGASESARARLSIQNGCLHFHSEEATDPSWDCQFFPIGGVDAEVGVVYTLHYKIKGSVAQNVSMLGFGLTPYGQFPITTDWVEGTVDYEAASNDGNLLMQCGDYVGDWDIAYLKITHEGKEERPVEWIEQLENGDAEKPWADPNVRFNDQENNFKICAWAKEKGRNMNENDGWDPFPADIEEVDGSHVFVVHGQVADTEGDPSAWDNQFWIQSPKMLKVGSQFKLHFRYKASEAATTNTQFHHQNPSDYVFYQAIGDINFTTEWQEYDGVVTVPEQATDAWSIAFNLNPQNKNAVNFYFDDLSLSLMKLDEGYFVASSNTATGIEYDFDNATEFTVDDDLIVATVGTKGKQDTWVNEVMISTVRGNDRAFKSSTLKPTGTVVNDPDTWLDYTEGSNAKIKLPAAGVWTISIDTEGKQMNFVKLEGEKDQEPLDIKPNTSVVVVHGQERDDLADTDTEVREEEGGTGQPWDNQFFILANRTLEAGEVTVLEFDYQSTIEAKTTTQCHGAPGAYMHWNCIGDVNFTPEMTHFRTTFTVPSEANGMQSIAFNMAEIKAACDYTITNVVWKLEDNTETLINETGVENFIVKEGAGTEPHVYVDPTGINNAVVGNTVSTAAYNLAGQRVSNSYKGIVVKNGKKFIVK
ncbi:MAG: hypothetical protein J6M41_05635 [Prevotella sp.]|nr:hypothetical protein [Prevotella sp.]